MLAVLDDKESLRSTLRRFSVAVAAGVSQGLSLGDAAGQSLDRMPAARAYFDAPVAPDGSGFGLRPEYLFPARNARVRALKFCVPGPGSTTTQLRFDPVEGDLALCARLLAAGASGVETTRSLLPKVGELSELAKVLLSDGFFAPSGRATVKPLAADGIYRLQHACLLFRSGGLGLLLDPHFHSAYAPAAIADDFSRAEVEGLVDVIALSHSHGDHYDLTSLMSFPRDIPVIVPRVPRPSVLCEDMAMRLRSLGFATVLDVDWYAEPIEFGDFRVEPLPFYGEQPLLSDWPRDRDLRNWGNTYMVETSQFSAWVLIDSGDDAAGRMIDVAQGLATRGRRVDVVLSNLREFAIHSPTYITGDGAYWASLSAAQMRRFDSMSRDLITLGPEGVAEICRVVLAGSFLPYAHWWAQRDAHPEPEIHLCQRLAHALRARGAATAIVPWTMGGRWHPAVAR